MALSVLRRTDGPFQPVPSSATGKWHGLGCTPVMVGNLPAHIP